MFEVAGEVVSFLETVLGFWGALQRGLSPSPVLKATPTPLETVLGFWWALQRGIFWLLLDARERARARSASRAGFKYGFKRTDLGKNHLKSIIYPVDKSGRLPAMTWKPTRYDVETYPL